MRNRANYPLVYLQSTYTRQRQQTGVCSFRERALLSQFPALVHLHRYTPIQPTLLTYLPTLPSNHLPNSSSSSIENTDPALAIDSSTKNPHSIFSYSPQVFLIIKLITITHSKLLYRTRKNGNERTFCTDLDEHNSLEA